MPSETLRISAPGNLLEYSGMRRPTYPQAVDSPDHPCAICGSITRSGLFPPQNVHASPNVWVPLCVEHKTLFLRGEMAFPRWCQVCSAWRSSERAHAHRRKSEANPEIRKKPERRIPT